MQIATVQDGCPWICTVYFVPDESGDLYWLSLPERRHSQEIDEDNHVAVAIAIKHDQPVVGIQAEGTAFVIDDPAIIKPVLNTYVEKYGSGKEFYDNFIAGKNQHKLYRFTPERSVLFDEVHFPGGQGIAI